MLYKNKTQKLIRNQKKWQWLSQRVILILMMINPPWSL